MFKTSCQSHSKAVSVFGRIDCIAHSYDHKCAQLHIRVCKMTSELRQVPGWSWDWELLHCGLLWGDVSAESWAATRIWKVAIDKVTLFRLLKSRGDNFLPFYSLNYLRVPWCSLCSWGSLMAEECIDNLHKVLVIIISIISITFFLSPSCSHHACVVQVSSTWSSLRFSNWDCVVTFVKVGQMLELHDCALRHRSSEPALFVTQCTLISEKNLQGCLGLFSTIVVLFCIG